MAKNQEGLKPRSVALIDELRGTSDSDKLEAYSNHSSHTVRLTVVSNPSTPDKALRAVSEADNSYAVLYAVAVHPNSTEETIDYVLNQNGVTDTIRVNGKELPILSAPKLEGIRREASSIAHKLVYEGKSKGEGPEGLNYKPLTETLQRRLFAYAKNLDPYADDLEVMRNILEHLSARDEVPYDIRLELVKLFTDNNLSTVVISAVWEFFRKHKNLPEEMLEILLNGENCRPLISLISSTDNPNHIERAFKVLVNIPAEDAESRKFDHLSLYSSTLANKDTPVEIAIKCYTVLNNLNDELGGNLYYARNIDTQLKTLLEYEGNGRKFLKSHGVESEDLPEPFLIKMVMLTATEKG